MRGVIPGWGDHRRTIRPRGSRRAALPRSSPWGS